MPHSIPLAAQVSGLAWVALRALAGTVLVTALAGLVLAGLSWYFLRELPWGWGLLAAALAVGESVAAGLALGVKRGVAAAVAHGLRALRLGGRLVGTLFDRLPGGAPSGGPGPVPVAQAEAQLSERAAEAEGEAAAGWTARLVQGRLLGAVRHYAVARFREEGGRSGGVDLARVREELERTIDDRLADKVLVTTRAWTVGVALGLPALAAAQAWLIALLAGR